MSLNILGFFDVTLKKKGFVGQKRKNTAKRNMSSAVCSDIVQVVFKLGRLGAFEVVFILEVVSIFYVVFQFAFIFEVVFIFMLFLVYRSYSFSMSSSFLRTLTKVISLVFII